MERVVMFGVTCAGRLGPTPLMQKWDSRGGGTPGRNGQRRKDGTIRKGPWAEVLCPLMAEYCKGPKCAWWLTDMDVCAIPVGAQALHIVATGGRVQGGSDLVRKIAEKMSMDP